MKNLKRVLSLGLASVMLLGMMVVGASAADFTDSADIEHSEAVDVLVALGVVNGMEDGSYFDPKGDVTRAQMAKMIAVIKMGGTNVNTGVKTTPTFTDIKGHWAESEIEYCADMGIISGRGDGTFDPDGKVTTTEVTKMVLTTLGYDATAYGLTGAGWAAQTDELARGASPRLYEDLSNDVIGNLPATRDTAAQLLWNGLQNNTRSFDPETSKSTGEVTWGYNDSKKTLIEERFDAQVATGRYVGNHYFSENGTTADEGKIIVDCTADEDYKKTFSAVPSDLSIDNIGEEVKVIWKDNAKGTKGEPDDKDTIFAVFNTGATKVVRGKLADIGDNKAKTAQIAISGTKYNLNDSGDNKSDGVALIYNYGYTTDKDSPYSGDDLKGTPKDVTTNEGDKNSKLVGKLKQTSGDLFKATFDDDNEIDKIYVTETYVAAVTAVNSTSVTLNSGVGTLEFEDHDIEEGLEKGDVVLFTPFYTDNYKDDKCVVTVVKAETASGEVDAFKDQESITVDGTKYSTNYKAKNGGKYGLLADIPDEDNEITKFEDKLIDEDVTLYLSNGYVVAAVQTSESANNYSVILEVKDGIAGSLFSGLQLQVMGADGTKEVITVSKDSKDNDKDYPTHSTNNGINSDDYQVGDIITYTFNEDDEAEVKVVGLADTGRLTYSDSTKSVGDGKTSNPTTGDCVLFVQTAKDKKPDDDNLVIADGEYEVYDIRSLDTLDESNVLCSIAKKDGKVVAAFINLGKDPDGSENNTVYGIVSAYDGKADKDYYKYTVQCNGEKYSILSKDHGGDSKLDKGALVNFKRTADDKYGNGKIHVYGAKNQEQLTRVYVDEYSARDNTLTFFYETKYDEKNKVYEGVEATREVYALDEDVVIVYVDKDGSKSEAEGSIDGFNVTDNLANAAILTTKDGDDTVIKVLFVETSGKYNFNVDSTMLHGPKA